MTVAIIGAAHAGLQIATSLREKGYDKSIVLIGDEGLAPYQRPPLSKDFLKGTLSPAALEFRIPAYYEQNSIELITGERVIGIDRTAHRLELASGRSLNFEKLALTTGSHPRRLSLAGADLPGVHYLRTVEDALRLSAALQSAARIAIIGAGFIGLEVAASALELGTQVTVIEMSDRLMGRSCGTVTGAYIRSAHEARGMQFRLEAKLDRIIGSSKGVQAVVLGDGTLIRQTEGFCYQ